MDRKSQLEARLTTWGFRKHLSHDAWRYVGHIINSRKAELKESVVILSGRHVPQGKVEYNKARNQRITWNPVTTPDDLGPDMPVYVCTPRPSSVDITSRSSWPDDLPWAHFINHYLGRILENIQFILPPSNGGRGAVHTFDKNELLQQLACQKDWRPSTREKSALLPFLLHEVAQQSLSIAIGSSELAIQLFAHKSIDRLAACFDNFIPETYQDENLQRVSVLVGGRFSDMQTESLKLILYLCSNGLVRYNHSAGLKQMGAIIALCTVSGLADPLILHSMVNLARVSWTVRAGIDTLFKASIITQSVGIVRCLLKFVDWINPNALSIETPESPFLSITPLEFAIKRGCIQLITALLDHGADIHQEAKLRLSWIPLVILRHPPRLATELVRLLLQKGASFNEPKGSLRLSALHAAIVKGDSNLVDILVSAGADLNARAGSNSLLDFNINIGTTIFHESLGCLGLAASFCYDDTEFQDRICRTVDGLPRITESDFLKGQRKALDLCQLLIHKHGHRMHIFPLGMAEAMLHAAANGYEEVVLFLRNLSVSIESTAGMISPLCAATYSGQTRVCRLLLELGAY
ncbi:ankyrin, partial [Thozetella sp. PMI_491]